MEQGSLIELFTTGSPFVSVEDEAVIDEKDPAESMLSLSDEEELEGVELEPSSL